VLVLLLVLSLLLVVINGVVQVEHQERVATIVKVVQVDLRLDGLSNSGDFADAESLPPVH